MKKLRIFKIQHDHGLSRTKQTHGSVQRFFVFGIEIVIMLQVLSFQNDRKPMVKNVFFLTMLLLASSYYQVGNADELTLPKAPNGYSVSLSAAAGFFPADSSLSRSVSEISPVKASVGRPLLCTMLTL